VKVRVNAASHLFSIRSTSMFVSLACSAERLTCRHE
jgi:hypothetical protein